MGKRNKALEVIHTVTDLLEPTPRNKQYLLPRTDLEGDAKVKACFDRYVNAVNSFKMARDELTVAKAGLQQILNTPIMDTGTISQSEYWDFQLDEDNDILYRNSEKSYRERLRNYSSHQANKRQEVKVRFDWTDKDTPKQPEGTSDLPFGGRSLGMLLASYRAITGQGRAQRRYEWYKTNIEIKDRFHFYEVMTPDENSELVKLLTNEEQDEVGYNDDVEEEQQRTVIK